MSLLPPALTESLHTVAREMREEFDGRGYRIDAALEHDVAFTTTRRSRSSLGRDIISDAFESASVRLGLTCRPGPGGSLEIYEEVEHGYAALRLRSAKKVGEELRVTTSSGSPWGGMDEYALLREYPFVFGYLIGGAGSLELFVAEVLNSGDDVKGFLVLGAETYLGGTYVPRTAFVPDADENLPGFEDDEEFGTTATA
jgi:hypothetical protein